jgi:hypothetical protein
VRWLPAALVILLAGCSGGPGPAAVPAPAPEVAILLLSGGGYAVVETRTGAIRGSLPAGILALRLSGGGDVAEAYLVSAAAGGGTTVDRVVPDRAFGLQPVAALDGVAKAAVLAGAPGLTTFVGAPTVLTVLTADGRLFGYQHGGLLWQDDPEPGRQLAGVGDETLVVSPLGWQRIILESGRLGPAEAASTCLPGPVAVAAGKVVYDCAGNLGAGQVGVPGGRPVASPDGASTYVATASGIDRVDAGSGRRRGLVKASGITSIALSRDGNYLYALTPGRLSTYAAATGRQAGSVAVDGRAIVQIAGG